MRQYNLKDIARGVALFCHRVKIGYNITASSIGLTNRQAHLLKIVLSCKFSKKEGAPIDFPRLFIAEDTRRVSFHKNTTPNNVDLSDWNTIIDIAKLMTYVSSRERNSENVKNADSPVLDLSRPHTVEVLKKKGSDIIVVFHFL